MQQYHNHTQHVPVMLAEVLNAISPKDGAVIVDGTFGVGGYSRAILESCACTVYAIDRDPDAIARAGDLKQEFGDRFHILQGCFGHMESLLADVGVDAVDGIVLDVGVSSPQLDESERGFSFNKDGPLDMRMSQDGTSAYDIVNTYDHGQLAHIIKQYGEEKMAGKVASAILRKREQSPIATTVQLADVVRSVVHMSGSKIDPATRTFQGIRIAVNDELGELEQALESSVTLLKNDGRLVVVSFHSLEDRLVKHFIKKNVGVKAGNRHMPELQNVPAVFRVSSHRPVVCSDGEAQENPRSRSAKLRMAIRVNPVV